MSIWNRNSGMLKNDDKNDVTANQTMPDGFSMPSYTVIDIEVGIKDYKIHDIGALRHDGATFHNASKEELFTFIGKTEYICGHNIIHHDAKYLFTDDICRHPLVDTLYMSPLLFPERPYHRLVKDDKLVSEQMNNPVNDCIKANDLLHNEIERWFSFPQKKRELFASLLKGKEEFDGFLRMTGASGVTSDIPEVLE